MACRKMTRPCDYQKFCRGITLVELLVVLGLIGILTALLLPAVQKARAAAQQARCLHNLKQVGLALQNYESSYTVYPMACGLPNYRGSPIRSPILDFKQYSVYTQLLPYLDQTPLYNSINFGAGLNDFYMFPELERGFAANVTVMAIRLDVLLCPADGGSPGGAATGGTNYRVNLGSDRWYTLQEGPNNGTLMSYKCSSTASITDGLSHTAAFSEKLIGHKDAARIDPRSGMIVGGLGLPYTAEQARAQCASQPGLAQEFYSTAGLTWFVGTMPQTCYNHILGPNDLVPDCALGRMNPVCGLFGARSDHAGGVNLAFADGSVRFVSESLRREVWAALGTCAGGEALPGDW